jgi:hypothetical protein
VQKPAAVKRGGIVGMADASRERQQRQRELEAREREQAKWRALSSPPPPPPIENRLPSASGGGLSVVEGVWVPMVIVVTLGLIGVVAGYHRTIRDWASPPKEGVMSTWYKAPAPSPEQRDVEYTGSVTAVPVAETLGAFRMQIPLIQCC